jgi:hypothetical protein
MVEYCHVTGDVATFLPEGYKSGLLGGFFAISENSVFIRLQVLKSLRTRFLSAFRERERV